MDIRNFFFKNRSFTPIPIAVSIIYFAQPDNQNILLGFAVLLAGELIRMWSVSYAGGETRTTSVGAPSLCTAGPYGFVRNPIYVGNMLMYLGIVIVAGSPNLMLMALATMSFFIIQYSLIISLEEEKLDELFGPDYTTYKSNVRAIIPRFTRWKTDDDRKPLPLFKLIKTEKRTLQNVTFILTLIVVRINYLY
jgi:protein-S-isoprenylcysteine O-methyltransferase Ste14